MATRGAQNAINEINAALSAADYSPTELARLTKDLERSRLRLVKREYSQTDFCGNTFNVPERTAEFFTYLNSYFLSGRTWAKVLEGLNATQFPSIVDLCPGWAPKVELALFYLGYRGKVMLVDRSEAATDEICRFMQLFSPAFALKKEPVDLFRDHLVRGDLVLANHVIDDLVLAYFAPQLGFDCGLIYQKEECMRAAWEKVLAEKDALDKVSPFLAKTLSRVVNSGGLLVLTQYKAYMEDLLDLEAAVSFNKQVLARIVEVLCTGGYFREKALVESCLGKFEGYYSQDECFVLRRE